MGMIVAVIMLMPVNPIKHIGDPSIERTKQRDQEYIQALEADGWKVIVLWECEIRGKFGRHNECINSGVVKSLC